MFEEEFAKVPNTYIADGHHRAASAYNVGKIRRQNRIDAGDNVTGEEPFNFFMALHYPADNLMILDYNRVLKSLNGLSSSDFIAKMSEHFTINQLAEGTDTKPGATHKFSLYIDNKWHSMVLKEESLDKSTPITQLDSQILTDLVFGPILGITDLKKDNRIDFVGGIRGHKELERRCQLDCVAAIALHPCSI